MSPAPIASSLGRDAAPLDGRQIFVIHIMKTAGTSLRRMLGDAYGEEQVYPNDHDLAGLPNGWYPSPADMAEAVRSGRLADKRVLIGHQPYVMAEEVLDRPFTITFVRDPIARAVSMIEHRLRKGGLAASYEDLLSKRAFVRRQIRDYQTKMFAFDSIAECAENVNIPLRIDDARFERALQRLERVEFIGIAEDFATSTQRLADRLGVKFRRELTANKGRYRAELSPRVRRRLERLVSRDLELYQRARDLARR